MGLFSREETENPLLSIATGNEVETRRMSIFSLITNDRMEGNGLKLHQAWSSIRYQEEFLHREGAAQGRDEVPSSGGI